MTNPDPETIDGQVPMVRAFPRPGQRVHLAYRELHLAVNGTAEQKQAIGPASQLPRPWDPSTCADPDLRSQLWAWIDEFVLWLNHEHTWDLAGTIPNCWPEHPHLVRELAVLADRRRRAALALNSDPLEDWHRYALPAFAERMRSRIKNHCEEGHQPWPGRGRSSRATSEDQRRKRENVFTADLDARSPFRQEERAQSPARPRLSIIDGALVDADTGEIQNRPT
jgi:hypothetical protein